MGSMEDYDRYMDERGHEACAQMLLRNHARERRELLNDIAWLHSELHGVEMEAKKLRELLAETLMPYRDYAKKYGIAPYLTDVNEHLDARLRELGVEV